MADIAYSNVTFNVVSERLVGGLREVEATIAFGNNALNYPTGGVPIFGKAHLGVTEIARQCRALGFSEEIKSLQIVDQGANAAGYKFEWDKTNGKIKVYVGAGFTPAGSNASSAVSGTADAQAFTGSALADHTHDMKVIGDQGDLPGDALTAPAATDLLGKYEPGDADILGADVATKGGIVAKTAGTPAGSNASSAVSGTAAAQAFTGAAVAAANLAQHANTTFVPNPCTLRVIAVGY